MEGDFDLIEVRDAIKLVRDFQEKKSMKLLNPSGLQSFAKLYKKYENELKIREYIHDTVKEEIQPLQIQNQNLKKSIDVLLSEIAGEKGIDLKETIESPVKVDDVEEEKEGIKWEEDKSDEVDVYKCENGHKITVIKNEDGTKYASIDEGVNKKIKSDKDIEKMKKEVENIEK